MKVSHYFIVLILICVMTEFTACRTEPLPSRSPSGNLTPPPTTSDLPFTIDCSDLGSSRQTECSDFIAATRDMVYPLLRSITGVSLSQCYDEIHYTILQELPISGAGGFTYRNEITYLPTYSIDGQYKYDVHELIHSFSYCSGALDDHIFHGMIRNYVYAKLGVHDLGYFTPENSFVSYLNQEKETVSTLSGQELIDTCKGILGGETTLAYFNLNELALQRLYRSTFVSTPH